MLTACCSTKISFSSSKLHVFVLIALNFQLYMVYIYYTTCNINCINEAALAVSRSFQSIELLLAFLKFAVSTDNLQNNYFCMGGRIFETFKQFCESKIYTLYLRPSTSSHLILDRFANILPS